MGHPDQPEYNRSPICKQEDHDALTLFGNNDFAIGVVFDLLCRGPGKFMSGFTKGTAT